MKMKLLLLAIVVLVVAGGAVWSLLLSGIPVETAKATTGSIREYVDERAVTRLPREYLITMPFGGRIEPIELVEGSPVKEGQIVARIVPSDVQLAVEEAEAAVGRLGASIRENEDVSVEKTGLQQSLSFVESMDRTVDAAEARVTSGKAKVDFAQSHLKRLEDARSRQPGAITADEIDEARLSLVESEVSYQQDKLVLAAMKAMQAATRLMPTMVKQYIERKDLSSDVLEKEQAEAQVRLARAKNDQRRATMTSPVDGVVLAREVTNEQYLTAGTELMRIGRLEDLEVEADVLSQEVTDIKVGDRADVSGPSIGPEPAIATVGRIYPAGFTKVSSLGVEQQRVKVVLDFDPSELSRLLHPADGQQGLGVDYRVRVRIFTKEKSDVVVVPRSAVFRRADGGWAVYVVDKGRAKHTHVTVGLMNDEQAEIVNGVTADMVVILAPETNLKDGDRVQYNEERRNNSRTESQTQSD